MAGVQIDGVNNKIDFDDDQDTSISANTDDTLVIEAGGNTLATFTATTLTINDGTTITTADNTDTLSLVSTDADANSGPNLRLYRNSSSPANDDVTGVLQFEGRNNNSQDFISSEIKSVTSDVADGSEDGYLAFSVMNGGTLNLLLGMTGTETVINDTSIDHDFRVESNSHTHMLHVDGGSNRVGVKLEPDLGDGLHIKTGDSGVSSINASHDELIIEGSGNSGIAILSSTSNAGAICFGDSGNNCIAYLNYDHATNAMAFGANAAERMRILSSGDVCISKTAANVTDTGVVLESVGAVVAVRDAGVCVIANRLSDDGEVIRIVQAGTDEGSIDVSGSTVSYNGFTGSHWSRLSDNSKPTILRGTIMESLDSMMNWYQAVADVAEVKYTAEDQAVILGDVNVGDVKTEAHTIKEDIALPDGKSVGDAVTFTHNGTEYTGVYAKENDVKHVHSKVSDSADSTRVYGVFHRWDDGDDGLDGDVNDLMVAQVGTYIIRVHKDVTVAAGDLLVSNGDGTAKKQDDDIIRSKTVAKVNSNIKIETYSDGSYTVPCTLHC
jgi:hypothetical protein